MIHIWQVWCSLIPGIIDVRWMRPQPLFGLPKSHRFIGGFFAPAFWYNILGGKKDRAVTNGLTDVKNSRNGSTIDEYESWELEVDLTGLYVHFTKSLSIIIMPQHTTHRYITCYIMHCCTGQSSICDHKATLYMYIYIYIYNIRLATCRTLTLHIVSIWY
jgi:hypothetical protein